MAELMGVSINTICEIETGKKFVRAETLVGFAALFKTEDILPDNTAGVLAEYSKDVKNAVDKIKGKYLAKMKR